MKIAAVIFGIILLATRVRADEAQASGGIGGKACQSVDCERDDVVAGRDYDVLLAAKRVADRIAPDGSTRLEPPKPLPRSSVEREERALCRSKHQASCR